MPARRARSTQTSTTMAGGTPMAGATTTARGHKRRRARRTTQQFGVARQGNGGADISRRVLNVIQAHGIKIPAQLLPGLSYSLNAEFGNR